MNVAFDMGIYECIIWCVLIIAWVVVMCKD